MCIRDRIEAAIDVLTKFGVQKEQIIVLHCNTEYPTPFEDVNLRAMLTIKEELGVKVGYSDHTKGIEVPIAAVAPVSYTHRVCRVNWMSKESLFFG